MTMTMDATQLNLINHVDEVTGASVGMWRNVNVSPLEWGQMLRDARRHNGMREFECTECGHVSVGQVPECTCPGCDG